MPSGSPVRTFVILWWTLGLALFFWSVQTAHGALASGRSPHPHAAFLGTVEAAAALLFLIPRTMRVGAAGLVCTLAFAFLAHAVQHAFRADLLVFVAAVLFVAAHGPVSRERLRPAP